MKLCDFLRNKTRVYELCVIRNYGYIFDSCWIDSTHLFLVHPELINLEVKGDSWGVLPITIENGNKMYVPCHYIDV